ncbi:MAG TPA: ATP-binding protein [Bryobacteraceae bacterium]|nr:ATP-binding protein [Bryobacteraceae bacterium]
MPQPIPFLGRAHESERLNRAFRSGEPLLLLGPRGCGKTRLIQEALAVNPRVLYVAWAPTLHALLTAMARGLLGARHAEFARRAAASADGFSPPPADPEAWLSAQTSLHLKGLLWTAMEKSPVPMVLDGIAGAGFPTYRFLQRIYHTRGMALFAAARDVPSLGALARLFWNPAQALSIPPLSAHDAGQLFEAAATHFGLRSLDLATFRDKTLESAHGNPGQIIEMCRLATEPQYRAGRQIKFSPLRIDTVMKFGA